MTRSLSAVLLAAVLAAAASGAIQSPIHLKHVVKEVDAIFTAEVTACEPDRPAVTLKVTGALRGKPPADALVVNMAGDDEAKKGKQPPELFARLKVKRTLVLFSTKQPGAAGGVELFAFTEGTWFQVKGTADKDKLRWALLHAEPAMRRTFAGTTAELTQVVKDALAGTKAPPAWNAKEPPGLGPVAPDPAKPKDAPAPASAPKPPAGFAAGPPVGVIPSFVLLGPLALVAAFFPGVFASLAAAATRWRALLSVASVNSTLALVYSLARDSLPAARWAGPHAFALLLLALTAAGLVWAGRRYRRLAAADPGVTRPAGRGELLTLVGLAALLAVFLAGLGFYAGWAELVAVPWREFTALTAGVVAAAAYAGYRALGPDAGTPDAVRLSLSAESVGLAAVLAFGGVALAATWPRGPGDARAVTGDAERGDATDAAGDGPRLEECKILWQSADVTEVLSGVAVTGERLVFGTRRQRGFSSTGAVHAVDRRTGKDVWAFTADGTLKPVFATPAVRAGRVYAGEGLHTDAGARLFCLNEATGTPAWPNPAATTSHTEAGPAFHGDLAIFPAGDDGVYAVDAATGARKWHLPGGDAGKLHVDTPAAVANGRAFVGSGYRTRALLALDAGTGNELWRALATLRSFGPPLVRGSAVYFGLGTGNLSADLSSEPEDGVPPETAPAGKVVALDAATGRELWATDLPKSVHTALAADARTVYAACRDGAVYALDRATGKLRWKRPVGGAFTAGPALSSFANGAVPFALYAVTTDGLLVCLSPADGRVFWSRDLKAQLGADVQVYSTPVVVTADPAGVRRELFVGAMVTDPATGTGRAVVVRAADAAGE